MANTSNQTSSSSPTFRVDVIFNSLRELQQEKERLEQHCHEEKARCRSLEIKLDACQTKYYQYSEKNCKMLETVNAAKQKVLQTQLQASRLKELNDGKGARITELRKQIDEEMRKEEEEMQVFQNKLAELTNNFRNARNYYTEENVKKEMEEWSKQAEETKSEVSKEDIALKELSAKFHQLEMETKSAKGELNRKLEFDVTAKELQTALTVFEEVNQEAKGKLEISEEALVEELER
ncbi:myosin-9-like [Orbicella faveolata]|uniref:myosin-9-like n=1 Tax=Orbicella faveolata TaxID=48498 RepID=UPI0009E55CFA|nr:myosin-9-like [Orbicella faveolata]